MKNFFSVDIVSEEKSYERYIVRKVSSQTARSQDSSDEQVSLMQKRARLPLWATIIKYICLWAAGIIFCGIVSALADSEDSIAESWARFKSHGAVPLITVAAVCFVVFLVLFIWGKKRAATVEKSAAFKTVLDECDKLTTNSYAELGVPSDADTIDIFGYGYKHNRKGKIVNAAIAEYVCTPMRVFKDDGYLYFADIENLIKIPLSAVSSVSQIQKRLSFIGWDHEVQPGKQPYKQYKIRQDNMGVLSVKGCLSVDLLLSGEQMQIIVPPYEKEKLAKLINNLVF